MEIRNKETLDNIKILADHQKELSAKKKQLEEENADIERHIASLSESLKQEDRIEFVRKNPYINCPFSQQEYSNILEMVLSLSRNKGWPLNARSFLRILTNYAYEKLHLMDLDKYWKQEEAIAYKRHSRRAINGAETKRRARDQGAQTRLD